MNSLIIGAVASGVAVLAIGLAMPRRKCPDCGEAFPRVRKPANADQALRGGNTCGKCGCEVDRAGRKKNSSPGAGAEQIPQASAMKRSIAKLVGWAFVWLLLFWFGSLIFVGAVAGALDPQHGSAAGARAGQSLSGLLLLLSLGLSVGLTAVGKLPGTRKKTQPRNGRQ